MLKENEILNLKFPVFTISGKEEKLEGIADFEEVSPGRRKVGKTISGNPDWVRTLPRVGTIWSPIVLDGAIPIFDFEETARLTVGEGGLVSKFGDIDVVELSSLKEVQDWVQKGESAQKIRFYILRQSQVSPAKLIGVSEISVEEFSRAKETSV
jgi:hypothetical protein